MIKILLYFYCSSSTIGIHTIFLVKLMKQSAVRFEFLITHFDRLQSRIVATSLVTWWGREFTDKFARHARLDRKPDPARITRLCKKSVPR